MLSSHFGAGKPGGDADFGGATNFLLSGSYIRWSLIPGGLFWFDEVLLVKLSCELER